MPMPVPVSCPYPTLTWTEAGVARTARWRSENGTAVPKRVDVVGDQTRADDALRLARAGTALLWRGDYHSARLLLQAMGRRLDRASERGVSTPAAAEQGSVTDQFHRHRLLQAQRARLMSALLVELDGDYAIGLRRAPDLRQACEEAFGSPDGVASVVSLRELLGLVGAHEWRKKGVSIPAVDGRIHAHYGVFSPVRGEYIDLVAAAALPSLDLAFDIGTGTGVLAAVLARRGVRRVVATDLDARALACAADNLQRLGLSKQVELTQADLFPAGRAPLVVCNPPWLPGKPSAGIEHAVYDPDSRMLRGFLRGLSAHLTPGGQGWLVLSDLAEHLGLRRRGELLAWIDEAGLRVLGCPSIRPRHPKASDASDVLHAARSAEVTSLWQLAAKANV